MGWRNLSGWTKGAIIGIFIASINLIPFLLGITRLGNFFIYMVLEYTSFIFILTNFPGEFMKDILNIRTISRFSQFSLIIDYIFWILLCGIIGLMIEKIKSRKNVRK